MALMMVGGWAVACGVREVGDGKGEGMGGFVGLSLIYE